MKRAFIPLALALLAVPTCASLPAPVQTDGTYVASHLPPFPIAVPTTRGPVPVILVRHLSRCGGAVDPKVVWYGCYHYGPPRFIEVEDTLSLYRKWYTLRHEMVHLALAIDGATLTDGAAENKVAEAIAKQEAHAMLLGWPR